MPCRLDARIAILDSVFTEFVDGRYSYTRVGDNTIRINNQNNNAKTRIKSKDYINEQANHMAKNLADRIWEKYNHHVIPKINNVDPYSPVTISLGVTDEYIEDAFIKLFPQTQIEFKEYFPNSITQKTYYHGSQSPDITRFKTELMGKANNGAGFNFTDNRDDAKVYGPYIYEVKLNISKWVTTDEEAKSNPTYGIDDVDETVVYNPDQIAILGVTAEELHHPTNQQLENMFEEWYKENSNTPEDEAREYFFSCKM
jgi:hypothetical protein